MKFIGTVLLLALHLCLNAQNIKVLVDISSFSTEKLESNLSIQLQVISKINENLLKQFDADPFANLTISTNDDLNTTLYNCILKHMNTKGVFVENKSNIKFRFDVILCALNFFSGKGWTATTKFDFTITSNNKNIFNSTLNGYSEKGGKSNSFDIAETALSESVFLALENINWTEIISSINSSNIIDNSDIPIATTSQKLNNQLLEQQTLSSSPESLIQQSDVDINIPLTSFVNDKTFVLIIGNENYDNEIPVNYAKNDARIFNEYMIKTLGVPEKHIHYVENATFGRMIKEINWLTNIIEAYQEEAKVIFYYAGHGMPDENSKKAYILPVDGSASEIQTAISLDDLYQSLNELPTKQITVFLDACFSGGARDGMLASGRGVKVRPKEDIPKGNIVVFSAVSGVQTAHPYEEQQHGLFSYYLMKKLQSTKGELTYGELGDYLKTEVYKKSVVNGREQTPQVIVSIHLQENWQAWIFK